MSTSYNTRVNGVSNFEDLPEDYIALLKAIYKAITKETVGKIKDFDEKEWFGRYLWEYCRPSGEEQVDSFAKKARNNNTSYSACSKMPLDGTTNVDKSEEFISTVCDFKEIDLIQFLDGFVLYADDKQKNIELLHEHKELVNKILLKNERKRLNSPSQLAASESISIESDGGTVSTQDSFNTKKSIFLRNFSLRLSSTTMMIVYLVITCFGGYHFYQAYQSKKLEEQVVNLAGKNRCRTWIKENVRELLNEGEMPLRIIKRLILNINNNLIPCHQAYKLFEDFTSFSSSITSLVGNQQLHFKAELATVYEHVENQRFSEGITILESLVKNDFSTIPSNFKEKFIVLHELLAKLYSMNGNFYKSASQYKLAASLSEMEKSLDYSTLALKSLKNHAKVNDDERHFQLVIKEGQELLKETDFLHSRRKQLVRTIAAAMYGLSELDKWHHYRETADQLLIKETSYCTQKAPNSGCYFLYSYLVESLVMPYFTGISNKDTLSLKKLQLANRLLPLMEVHSETLGSREMLTGSSLRLATEFFLADKNKDEDKKQKIITDLTQKFKHIHDEIDSNNFTSFYKYSVIVFIIGDLDDTYVWDKVLEIEARTSPNYVKNSPHLSELKKHIKLIALHNKWKASKQLSVLKKLIHMAKPESRKIETLRDASRYIIYATVLSDYGRETNTDQILKEAAWSFYQVASYFKYNIDYRNLGAVDIYNSPSLHKIVDILSEVMTVFKRMNEDSVDECTQQLKNSVYEQQFLIALFMISVEKNENTNEQLEFLSKPMSSDEKLVECFG